MTNDTTNEVVFDEDETATPDDAQSKYIQREVERLAVVGRMEDAYSMYLTDPTLKQPVATFEEFTQANS